LKKEKFQNMEMLKKPFWLLLTVTIPQVLLMYLFYLSYGVIESLLSANDKEQWEYVSYWYIFINAGVILYAFVKHQKKELLTLKFTWTLLLVHILSLTIHFYFSHELIPRSIPRWMLTSEDIKTYPYSFVIPGALHAVLLLVVHYTKEGSNAFAKLGVAILLPAGVFIGFSLVFSLDLDRTWMKYIFIFLLVFSVLTFLFFIFQAAYLLGKQKGKGARLTVRILFCLVFPVIGIALNNGFVNDLSGGIFGDFQHPAFIIIAVLNGILLSIPSSGNLKLRLLQYILKAVFLSYIVYFFIVFLPWLPISILAIILFGIGFLMVSPVFAFSIHVSDLRADFEFLKFTYNKTLLRLIIIGGFLVIPTGITLNFIKERAELMSCLEYLYDRSYQNNNEHKFDEGRLSNLLNHLDQVKEVREYKQVPFIDSYYNWLVLDNLLLSDKKINSIKEIIIGEDFSSKRTRWLGRWVYPQEQVTLDKYTIESKYDEEHGFWRTWVHLDLQTELSNNQQFKAYLKTQPGTFISDYYLTIDGKDKHGILAEKRTAKWVYDNIVKTRRDPGLLEMISPGNYSLYVYPVSSSLPRTSGIEFIHKHATTINFDGKIIKLGDNWVGKTVEYEISEVNGLIYVPKEAKKLLGKVVRPLEYHLLLDWSVTVNKDSIINMTEQFIKQIGSANVKVYLQNYNNLNLPIENWKSKALEQEAYGGFYPEYQIKKIFINNYLSKSVDLPVIVMITDDVENVNYLDGLSSIIPFSQGVNKVYGIDYSKAVFNIDIQSGMDTLQTDFIPPNPNFLKVIRNETSFYVSDDDRTEVLYTTDSSYSKLAKQSNQWQKGMLLKQLELKDELHPEENLWLPIIKRSFNARVVSKFTSFLSLENEAQEKMLLHKQAQVLNSNKNLDLGEEVKNMSEPSILWYILGGVFIFLYCKRKSRLRVA
jgi:hypothetical protein